MPEAVRLPVDFYLLCLKKGTVERLRATPEGRQYLDDCERYRQTKMDRAGLRRMLAETRIAAGAAREE